MFNVSKGRDGRRAEVISKDDVSDTIYTLLVKKDLTACEKWLSLPLLDLLDKTCLTLSNLREIKNIAARKLCPEIHIASQQSSDLKTSVLSFGSRKLDSTFGDLLSSGKLLEVWGSAGSGKTQLALQMCSALSPSHYSAYISTEGTISTSRLFDMCSARGLHKAHCDIQVCSTVDSFEECVMRQLPLLIATKPVKLVIIDSIAAPFRCGEVEGGGVKRAQRIRAIGQQLKYLASANSILVVVLNQATASPTLGTQPALGLTWSYLINSRLRIQKLEYDTEVGRRRVTVERGSCIKSGTFVDCVIKKEGLL